MQRPLVALHVVSLVAAAALASPARGQSIRNGRYAVRLDPIGVLTRPPDEGLVTTYGPRVECLPGTTECFGLAYDSSTGHVSAVGAGPTGDDSQRIPVRSVSSRFTVTDAVMVGRVGAVEIVHRFYFCPFTESLIVGVTLSNTGSAPLHDVVYSREWRSSSLVGGTFPPELDSALPPAPGNVWRMAFELHELPVGATVGRGLVLVPASRSTSSKLGPSADDVPLRQWTNASFPAGLNFGAALGISFGDYDQDGWSDVVVATERRIWRNLAGVDWKEQVDLSPWMDAGQRYSAALFDYDNDGRVDLADEPRGGGCLQLLHSLGGDLFEEVAGDPDIVDDRPCMAWCETNSVADVDGISRFTERVAAAGLRNPADPRSVPEGAGFADVDDDGDVDLYACISLYRNVSKAKDPRFELLSPASSGITMNGDAEEGGGFFDYDMDGDIDLCIAHVDPRRGIRMYENRGDGMLELQAKSLFDSADTGLGLGLSFEDWDNDGDIDVTSSEVFRRNQFIESGGTRHFTVATHSIPPDHITNATPAWGDWDQDGDIDSALANYLEVARLYDNTLYDATTPPEVRRHLRVRVVRDSAAHESRLDLGRLPEPRRVRRPTGVADRSRSRPGEGRPLRGDRRLQGQRAAGDGARRSPRQSGAGRSRPRAVARSPDRDRSQRASPDRRLRFPARRGDATVDDGEWQPRAVGRRRRPSRPDRRARQRLVRRDGDRHVRRDAPAAHRGGGDRWQGRRRRRLRRHEREPLRLGRDRSAAAGLAAGGLSAAPIRARNHRNGYAIDATLQPGRIYRLAARVQTLRSTPFAGPRLDGALTTRGSLSFKDPSPCSGAAIVAASVDPTQLFLTIRFRDEPAGAWADFGHALAGTNGPPLLTMSGDLRPLSVVTADVSGALANAPLFLVVGLTPTCVPFASGVLVPAPDIVLANLVTDATGRLSYSDCVADDIASGESFFVQALLLDPGAPRGVALTNAMVGTTPN